MNKQLTYQLLSFIEREITIFSGDHAMRNLDASLRQARMLRNLNRSVYYINSAFSAWTFMARARAILGPNATDGFMKRFKYTTVTRGALARARDEVVQELRSSASSVVIINSWEFASCGPRYREELLFLLKRLVTEEEMTVIVWSQTDVEGEAGAIKRGGVGKLAAAARHIEPIAKALRPLEQTAEALADASPDALEPKLFAECAVIDEDGEVALAVEEVPVITPIVSTQALTVPQAESEQRAIVLSRPDVDPESYDLDRVCVNLNANFYNNLQGEIPCPWENLADAAFDVLGGAYDPLSKHFAPGLWCSAMSMFNEDPSMYPPLPECWKDVYKTRTMFRELARQSGFSYQRLCDVNEESKRYAAANAEPDEKLRAERLKALEPKYLDGAIFWDDADIVRQRGKDGLKQVQKLRKSLGWPKAVVSCWLLVGIFATCRPFFVSKDTGFSSSAWKGTNPLIFILNRLNGMQNFGYCQFNSTAQKASIVLS